MPRGGAARPFVPPAAEARERFAGIYAAEHGRILGYCLRLLGSEEEARDATQDVFLRAWRAIGRMPPDLAVRDWLYRIARNRCMDLLRRRQVIRWERLDAPPTLGRCFAHQRDEGEALTWAELAGAEGRARNGGSADGGSPEALLERHLEALQARRILQAALPRLGEEQRDLLVSFHLGGLTCDELRARRGACSRVAVKARLWRARLRARALCTQAAAALPDDLTLLATAAEEEQP